MDPVAPEAAAKTPETKPVRPVPGGAIDHVRDGADGRQVEPRAQVGLLGPLEVPLQALRRLGDRFLDTLVGVATGLLVNLLVAPPLQQPTLRPRHPIGSRLDLRQPLPRCNHLVVVVFAEGSPTLTSLDRHCSLSRILTRNGYIRKCNISK